MGRSGSSRRDGIAAGATRHERAHPPCFVRDIRIAVRVGGGALIGVLFFLIVVTLMPFAVGPDLALLQRIGPAILWLGALLASLLALDRLLAADQEDGSLDLIADGPRAARARGRGQGAGALAHHRPAAGHRRAACSALLLNLDPPATAAVALTLLAGTPALTFIGLIGAALTVTLAPRRPAAPRAGPAADRSGADFRRRGLERRHRRAAAVRHAVHHPVRADPGQPRDRPVRRGAALRHGQE